MGTGDFLNHRQEMSEKRIDNRRSVATKESGGLIHITIYAICHSGAGAATSSRGLRTEDDELYF